MFFVTEKAKETVLDFLEGTVKTLCFYFVLIWYKMTQYNMLNVKLHSSQINKLKSPIKNGIEVTESFIKYCWWF